MPQTITDTSAAALYFDVTPATVRSWINRGRVQHHGHDRRGRALVDLREVRDYLHARQGPRKPPERTG
ncbi:helix-turn-helix domain-containing protein [Streptomyces sp. NPDC056149]|uniref:helix-turn-helix domain-containing protein n=1 Tax=Streptomyces sp. NPDC056149 TaxID=3345728 RepID=UPI0035E2A6DA